MYIDDGLTAERGYHMCRLSFLFSTYIVSLAGWTIKKQKCNPLPQQQIKYLGYNLDATKMQISLPEDKIVKTSMLLNNAIDVYQANKSMKCTDLAAITGQLCHLIFTHGSLVRICSRLFINFIYKFISDFYNYHITII